MPSPTWDLALAELIYYIPASIPVAYCLYKHRHAGLSGWFFFTAFVVLQIVGSGLVLSAGQHGTPSSTAITITSVGLSPLILAAADIIKEWATLAGFLESKKQRTFALLGEVVYHVAVIAAIAIYARGASRYASNNSDDSANAEWRTGIILLLLLWLLLCLVFIVLAHKTVRVSTSSIPSGSSSKALFWALMVSLGWIGDRVIYQCVATFNKDQGSFNPVTGSIALRVIFQFLPGAFTLLALVVGGIMSTEEVAMAQTSPTSDVEMTARIDEATQVFK